MSLEAAVAANTAAIERLTAVLQSGAITPAPQPETAAGGKGKNKPTTTPAATPTPSAASAGPAADQLQRAYGMTNSTGRSIYIHIEANRTVAEIRPGEVVPSIPGAMEIGAEKYESLKAQYTPASASPPSAAGAPSASPVASTAASTPAASTASSPSPATSAQAALDGPTIVAKCQALHKAQGNAGLKEVLDQFGATKVPELVTKADQFAAIAAFIDAKLNPQPAAAPAEGSNLFG